MQRYKKYFNPYTKQCEILEQERKEKNGVQHTLYAILPQAQHKTAYSSILGLLWYKLLCYVLSLSESPDSALETPFFNRSNDWFWASM